MESFVVGHHHIKSIWTPRIGEELICIRERNNEYDPRAVGVYKETDGRIKLVGRVPREHSLFLYNILAAGGEVTCVITGKRENRRRRGLEVPCTYYH